jgi:hypothetical protein
MLFGPFGSSPQTIYRSVELDFSRLHERVPFSRISTVLFIRRTIYVMAATCRSAILPGGQRHLSRPPKPSVANARPFGWIDGPVNTAIDRGDRSNSSSTASTAIQRVQTVSTWSSLQAPKPRRRVATMLKRQADAFFFFGGEATA